MMAIVESTATPRVPVHLSPLCRDFLGSCLARDPAARLLPSQLLDHPFVAVTGLPSRSVVCHASFAAIFSAPLHLYFASPCAHTHKKPAPPVF